MSKTCFNSLSQRDNIISHIIETCTKHIAASADSINFVPDSFNIYMNLMHVNKKNNSNPRPYDKYFEDTFKYYNLIMPTDSKSAIHPSESKLKHLDRILFTGNSDVAKKKTCDTLYFKIVLSKELQCKKKRSMKKHADDVYSCIDSPKPTNKSRQPSQSRQSLATTEYIPISKPHTPHKGLKQAKPKKPPSAKVVTPADSAADRRYIRMKKTEPQEGHKVSPKNERNGQPNNTYSNLMAEVLAYERKNVVRKQQAKKPPSAKVDVRKTPLVTKSPIGSKTKSPSVKVKTPINLSASRPRRNVDPGPLNNLSKFSPPIMNEFIPSKNKKTASAIPSKKRKSIDPGSSPRMNGSNNKISRSVSTRSR